MLVEEKLMDSRQRHSGIQTRKSFINNLTYGALNDRLLHYKLEALNAEIGSEILSCTGDGMRSCEAHPTE